MCVFSVLRTSTFIFAKQWEACLEHKTTEKMGDFTEEWDSVGLALLAQVFPLTSVLLSVWALKLGSFCRINHSVGVSLVNRLNRRCVSAEFGTKPNSINSPPWETGLPVVLSCDPATKFSASPLPCISSLYLRYVKDRLASSSAQKCYAAIKKLICSHENFVASDENYRKGCEDNSKA